MRPGPGRLLRVLVAGAAALVMVVGPGPSAGAAASVTPAASSTANSTPFCAPATPGRKSCLGLALEPSAARRQLAARPGTTPAPGGGYAPQDIQSAYGLTSTASTNGAGQTVALVEAYHDATAASDLAAYRAYFSLPTCTAASGCFQQVDLSGGTPSPPNDDWTPETSLDMDAVSSACPLCHILIVEAADDSDPELIAAIRKASTLGPTVMNLSFGGCESGTGNYDSALQATGLPVTVATGDNGYFAADNQGCPTGTPEYPASSPDVTAVGGTSLTRTSGGRGWTETAWQYSGGQAGGSGCSSFEPKPSWQSDRGCPNFRTVADVSADADPNTGLAVYVTDASVPGGWGEFGGTSLSAPLIAGMYALAGSPPAAIDGHIWYMSAAVNDVVTGSNAARTSDCNPAYLCNAEPGYDGPTGVGTPKGAPIIQPAVTQLTSPASSTAIPLSWSAPPNIQPTTYQVWEQDATTGGGWLSYLFTTGTSTTFYGFKGHRYSFYVQYVTASGASNGSPSASAASTTIAANATEAMRFAGMYAVDGLGAIHPASSPPLPVTFGFTWDIARGIVASPTGDGGVVLDGWGGLHSFGDAGGISDASYWPGWDIARGIVALPPQSPTKWSGYVLDGWGGLHGFAVGGAAMPPSVSGSAYWSGWSIARGVASFADGSGGLVLDGWGGLHPFAVGNNPQPASANSSSYWPGWDIARSVVLLPGSTANNYSGYVLDGWGGLHPFAAANTTMPPAINPGFYRAGWDIARSVVLDPGSSVAGYIVDGFGGFNPFGGAPSAVTPNYGVDGALVRGAAAA